MDGDRFDRFVRGFARRTSRRRLLGWIPIAGLAAAAGAAAQDNPADVPCQAGRPQCAPNRSKVVVAGVCWCRCDKRGQGFCCGDERSCGGRCVPKETCCANERQCTTKSKGKPGTECKPAGECCDDEKPCGSGCVKKDACCPATERECRTTVGKGKKAKEKITCVALDTCCPLEKPCAGAASGCCNEFAGQECTLFDGCCDTLNGGKKTCEGKWCCDERDECVPGVGCRKSGQCPSGETECAAPNGEITACCNPGELCCNGICCGRSIAPVSRCCGTRAACYGIGSPCPA